MKYLPAAVLLIAVSGPVKAEQARRFFEIGADAGLGFANNLLGAKDILKKNVVIDLNDLNGEVADSGLKFNTGVDARAFINVAFGEKADPNACNKVKINPGENGFGLSAGVHGGIFGNAPKSIMTFLAEGNIPEDKRSPSGDFTAYGGLYADAEVDVHFKLFKKLRIGIAPAMYLPLLYIPKSSIHYNLTAEDSLNIEANGAINVYSPFSIEGGSINLDIDPLALVKQSGYDLSLSVSYDFLRFLTAGLDVMHIPLYPSKLDYQISYTSEFAMNGDGLLTGAGLIIPSSDDLFKPDDDSDESSYTVRRPLRFDLYGMLHWGKTPRYDWLQIRPNLGCTILNPAEEFWFNAGIDVRLNFKNAIIFHIGTGYEETLWKHRAGLAFNLRVFELDIEAGLQSQEFLKSFQLTGLLAGVGIRIGF